MVREGISAYRAGRKDEARALLLRATEIDQYNEQAWLWLSAVVESPEEARTCLENVLTINPNNERARNGIDTLTQRASGTRPASSPQAQQQAEDILASASFGAPAGKRADGDELPTSIEWGGGDQSAVASSSISMNYNVKEPSKQEYDDWVSGLGIGNAAVDPFAASPGAAPNPFGDTGGNLYDDATQLGSPGDLFAAGPFQAEPPTPPPPSKPAARPATAPKQSPPEKVYAELEEDEAPAPAKSTLSQRMSAVSNKSAAAKAPVDDALDLLDNIASESNDLLNDGFDDSYDSTEFAKVEADELFGYIPKSIRPTRLPGTSEGYPVPLLIGLVAVILLNIGAVAFFIMNLTRGA
jgi:tetratricopeptide (TPR) repeat protein